MAANRVLGILVLGLGTSCSTVLAPPTACTSDDDCSDGEVCLVDLGGTCHDANEVPRNLGFVLCDRQSISSGDCTFRTELRTDDHLVHEVPPTPSSFRVSRDQISDYVKLTFQYLSPKPANRQATFDLWQPSRFNLQERLSVQGQIDTQPEDDPPVAFPFFDLRDIEPEELVRSRRSIVAEITPEALGREYHYLMRSTTNRAVCTENEDCGSARYCIQEVGQCSPLATTPSSPDSYPLQTSDETQLEIVGTTHEVSSSGQTSPLSDIEVTIRYPTGPDEPTVPIFGTMEALLCEDDSQCLPDVTRCDPDTNECVLRLGGRSAGPTLYSAEFGSFTGRVNLRGTQRQAFTLTAQDRELVRPQMTLALELPLEEPPSTASITVCLPEWAPAENVEVQVLGDPQTLWSANGAEWTCCDTTCLPTDETSVPVEDGRLCIGAVGTAQAPIIRLDREVQASEFASVTSLPEWIDRGCLDIVSTDGVAGRVLRRDESCASRIDPCLVSVSPGVPGDGRPYRIRVEPRSGSVLESRVLPEVFIRPQEPLLVDLPPRPRLLGRVLLPETLCDEDNGQSCGAARATVMAERLRLDDEDPNDVLGPYFYSTTTFYDPNTGASGAYVLPVNAGVYLVTALPDTRSGAAPADIAIVDLRRDNDDAIERELDLQLRRGIPIVLKLDDFTAPNVTPLDLGSWRSLCHPDIGDPCAEDCDRTLDLNAANECYVERTTTAGCRIRTLVPEGVALYPNVADEVQFLARGRRDICDE